MTEFFVDVSSDFGRTGTLSVRNGSVSTPALFPVVNMIGGTTLDSGSSHRHFRDNILDQDHLQGVLYQAMSFLDYGLTPDQLQDWREQTFREHLSDRVSVDAPIFIDSGGFALMNSETFGDSPSSSDDDWRIYTDADSILKLQADYGGDIIATLDYPIPPNLNEDEQMERMNKSIESAIRCLKLVENPDEITIRDEYAEEDRNSVRRLKQEKQESEPAVFVALHGHDYETINWYVMNFLERLEEEGISQHFQGFAVGSLVPLRDKIDILVDIIQGAQDAIPPSLQDEIALHVFGVGGKQASMLALLGVDTFDCSTHMQTARYRKYIVPHSWERVHVEDFEAEFGNTFPCDIDTCPLCTMSGEATDEEGTPLTPPKISEYLLREPTYGVDGFTKSAYYGWLARHNFEVYNDEVRRVRAAIENGELLDYVVEFARRDEDIRRMLKRAQVRDATLRAALEERNAYDLLPGPAIATDQTKLSEFIDGLETENSTQTISLEHSPSEFNILNRRFEPPEKDILLVLPCSKEKPYENSRSQQAVLSRVSPIRDDIHKLTISGMFGPVPEEHEEDEIILDYEYVLASQDTDQQELVIGRLTRYLDTYADAYDEVVGYATNKTYRHVIETAFEQADCGTVFPTDPESLRPLEHFRKTNIKELTDYLGVSETVALAELD